MESGLIFSEGQLRGHLAMWVARQSPYRSVDGVDDVGTLITTSTKANDWFGPDDCRMRRFTDWRDLERWLRSAIGEHPQLTAWNTRRNGRDGNQFISRYDTPSPDDDFIDIDALFRNVAIHAWRESEAESAMNSKIDGSTMLPGTQ